MQPIEAIIASKESVRHPPPEKGRQPKDKKADDVQRGSTLPRQTRKLSEIAAQVAQTAIKEEQKTAHDFARIKAICQVVFNGAFCTMLKNSTLISPEDKDYLKRKGFI